MGLSGDGHPGLTTKTPHTRVIGSAEARANLKDNAAGSWPAIAGQFGGQIWPQLQPSFRLKATDTTPDSMMNR